MASFLKTTCLYADECLTITQFVNQSTSPFMIKDSAGNIKAQITAGPQGACLGEQWLELGGGNNANQAGMRHTASTNKYLMFDNGSGAGEWQGYFGAYIKSQEANKILGLFDSNTGNVIQSGHDSLVALDVKGSSSHTADLQTWTCGTSAVACLTADGTFHATFYYGDGSYLTGITVPTPTLQCVLLCCNYASGSSIYMNNGSGAGGTLYMECGDIICANNVCAYNFYGCASGLTGIPNPFNQNLNTSDNVCFSFACASTLVANGDVQGLNFIINNSGTCSPGISASVGSITCLTVCNGIVVGLS